MRKLRKESLRLIVSSIVFIVCVAGLLAYMFWVNRVEVDDPVICEDSKTLAIETVRRLKNGSLSWYEMLYCPGMKDKWSISVSD